MGVGVDQPATGDSTRGKSGGAGSRATSVEVRP
jgi:hypothetical protein